MSTKVDQPSAVEPRTIKMSGTTSSGTSTSGSKVSMFAAKSGFVIPKNKLSGSLVPIFRGGKKPEGSDAAKEESTKQVQRKTKWGPDLTQDAAVRNGRALAYQTRVDQITQQLKLGNLEYGAKKVSPSSQHPEYESSCHQSDSEESELLELEKREAIGEILRLNPSYKAPPDYKPLLKEARVPIPVKEYPGYNFVGLIFGPGSDTQKRLEKETGVKIQVQGTKSDTGEKVEISPSDRNEIHGTYEELYVHVSADTFEKVDAAVALIEMLVTSVSGNLTAVSTTSTSVSGDKVNVLPQSEGATTPYMVPTVVNQGVMQPVMGPTQTRPQGQLQYPGPWFSTGPPQAHMPSPSGFIPTPNTSAPILGSPFNPSNMPSLFGPRPTLGAGFNSIFRNQSLVHPRTNPPTQSFQHPYMPQTQPGPPRIRQILAPQPSSAQSTTLAPLSFTASQPSPTGLASNPRQLMPSLPQPMSNVPPGPLPDWQSAPAGSFKGWSTSSMGQMVPPQGPRLVPQPSFMSAAPPSNIAGANMASPVTFPSQPSPLPLSSAPMNRPAAQIFSSGPPQQVGYTPASSVSLHPTRIPAPAPTSIQSSSAFAPLLSTSQPQPPQSGIPSSVSASIPNFTPLKPPTLTTPRLPHPSSGDFTFQPHRPQNLSSQQVPSASSQPATQNILPPNPLVQPLLSPHAAPFQLAIHNSTLQPAMQGFLRPPVPNQMGQPPNQISAANFAGRLPAFSSANNFAPTTRIPHIGPRNFSPGPRTPNMAGPFPPRPGNAMQNYPAPAARPEVLMPPNQQLRNNISFASGKPTPNPSGGQQIYDPFSPTSVSIAAQQPGGNLAVRRQENDPEYDDLMESVGVK